MMTVLEFLSTTKHIYEQLKIYRISASDVVYVEMVKEYNQMVAEGRKESSVKALMERKYKLSASTVRGAIKANFTQVMGEDFFCIIHARIAKAGLRDAVILKSGFIFYGSFL